MPRGAASTSPRWSASSPDPPERLAPLTFGLPVERLRDGWHADNDSVGTALAVAGALGDALDGREERPNPRLRRVV